MDREWIKYYLAGLDEALIDADDVIRYQTADFDWQDFDIGRGSKGSSRRPVDEDHLNFYDKTLSAVHAQLIYGDSKFYLRDTSSRHGTACLHRSADTVEICRFNRDIRIRGGEVICLTLTKSLLASGHSEIDALDLAKSARIFLKFLCEGNRFALVKLDSKEIASRVDQGEDVADIFFHSNDDAANRYEDNLSVLDDDDPFELHGSDQITYIEQVVNVEDREPATLQSSDSGASTDSDSDSDVSSSSAALDVQSDSDSEPVSDLVSDPISEPSSDSDLDLKDGTAEVQLCACDGCDVLDEFEHGIESRKHARDDDDDESSEDDIVIDSLRADSDSSDSGSDSDSDSDLADSTPAPKRRKLASTSSLKKDFGLLVTGAALGSILTIAGLAKLGSDL